MTLLLFVGVATVGCGGDPAKEDATNADGGSTEAGAKDEASKKPEADTTPGDYEGKLIQQDATPYVEAATIRLFKDESADTPLAEVKTSDGAFTLENLPPGEYFIVAVADDTASNTRCRSQVYLEKGGSPLSLFMLAGGSVTGRAVVGGVPLEGATVKVRQIYIDRDDQSVADIRAEIASTQTDGDGRFEFDYVLPGPKVVVIEKPGGDEAESEVSVEPGKVHDLGDLEI